MAQVQLHRNLAPLKLDGAATQITLDGIIAQLQSDQWIRNHDAAYMQRLGDFAVKEKNRRANWHLKFKKVIEGWCQLVPGGRGLIHLLHLVAEHEDVLTHYEAYIWEKPHCPLDGVKPYSLELRSLSPLVQENPAIEPYA